MADRESEHHPRPVRLRHQRLVGPAIVVAAAVLGVWLVAGRVETAKDVVALNAQPPQTARAQPLPIGQSRTQTRRNNGYRVGGASLSLDQFAGQRVIYAYSGLQPPSSLLALIHAGETAGVILFGPNIASPGQIHVVVRRMQKASLTSPLHIPLLILTDQEGGQVRRLPGAPVRSEKQIGASTNPVALASQSGRGAGENLASAGINANLAPVLDIFRQRGNFIDQFQRSYSSNAANVSRLGAAFIAAQQRTGVAATAKHFPGLGSATRDQNTDLRPTVLGSSLSTLRSVDELPYRAAISSGVKLVMLSWGTYPALDPTHPAGLSPTVIQHELRRRLGFRGVTITDGIDAGAVLPFGRLAPRSVQAAAAGADLILCADTNPSRNTPALGLMVLHALASALSHHLISQVDARGAVSRVLSLRANP